VFTIGYFAMHAFWATYSKSPEVKERARNMLTGLITALLPHNRQRYTGLLAHAAIGGECRDGLHAEGVCTHMRSVQAEFNNRSGGRTPQETLADLVVELSRAVAKPIPCATAASALKRMFTAMSRIADFESERYAGNPLKDEVSTMPDRTNQRGVRRRETVLRACSEGIATSGAARSGHETAKVMHDMDAREMGILENQTTTQYRVCAKRRFANAFGPWGSQNDGARLGNPAAATDLYVVQNHRMQRAAVLPNQAFLFLEVSR
jgi:hypothetical protein